MVAKLLLRLSIVGGQVAQLVEQRTENPCVAGSIPALAISNALKRRDLASAGLAGLDPISRTGG